MFTPDENLDLLPGWRRAYRSFNEQAFAVGAIISDAWLERELGIEYPATGTAETFDKIRLKWLAEFGRFHETLQEERQLFLRRDGAKYVVLTAAEQLAHAQTEGRRRIKNALRWQAQVLSATNVNTLSDMERTQHADAMARLARLRSFSKGLLPAPIKKDDES